MSVSLWRLIAQQWMDIFERCTEHDRSMEGWGLERFISHADLYRPEEGKEYLKNDTLKFRVTKVYSSY